MIYQYVSKYRFPLIALGLNIFGLVSLTIWVIIALSSSNQPQIIQYANSLGIFRIGSVWDILMLVFTGIVFAVADYFLAISLCGRSRFLSLLASSVSVFICALIFIAVSAMIGVN